MLKVLMFRFGCFYLYAKFSLSSIVPFVPTSRRIIFLLPSFSGPASQARRAALGVLGAGENHPHIRARRDPRAAPRPLALRPRRGGSPTHHEQHQLVFRFWAVREQQQRRRGCPARRVAGHSGAAARP